MNKLVVLDYAMHYPEAVPLHKTTSMNIARELLLLSSHVGIPRDILSDQGTPFTLLLAAASAAPSVHGVHVIRALARVLSTGPP